MSEDKQLQDRGVLRGWFCRAIIIRDGEMTARIAAMYLRTENQLEAIAHLLLPMALPEPLPIWWRLDEHHHALEAELVFALRDVLCPVLRRASSHASA